MTSYIRATAEHSIHEGKIDEFKEREKEFDERLERLQQVPPPMSELLEMSKDWHKPPAAASDVGKIGERMEE